MRHVVDSPWWLLWLFARPKTRAMARWNRLEQAEVTAQTASLNLRPPASCDSFVRAAAQRVSLPTGVERQKGADTLVLTADRPTHVDHVVLRQGAIEKLSAKE